MMDDLSIILLAGGMGTRMQSQIPKQFLQLGNKPIALHSYDLFQKLNLEIVVVVNEDYHHLFPGALFAAPGKRRQDSVESGLAKCSKEWILVHDSARPFITLEMVEKLYSAAKKTGAATTGMPMIATVKQACCQNLVEKTLDRDRIWEIQTPQIVRREILIEGFAKGCEVTDDVSLAELVGIPVQLVEGSRFNMKITTADDLILARKLYEI